jgi:hypothetical protein
MNALEASKISKIAILGVIIALGLTLRLWGNTFGLPYRYAPDEDGKVKVVLQYEEKGFKHLGRQPSFLFNSLCILFKVSKFARPYIESNSSLQKLSLSNTAFFLWVGRCWMALLGAATVFFVYLLGKRVWDEGAGIFAAALYAFCPLPVVSAHYIKEDTPLTLWVTITLLLCIPLLERGAKKDYFYAGLASGAAFSTKYNGALTFLLVVIAPFLRKNTQDLLSNSANQQHDRKISLLLLSGASFIIGFAIISPALLLRLGAFFKGVIFQSKYMIEGHGDGITVSALDHFFTFYLRKSLFPGVTLPVMLGALVGMWKLWKEKRGLAILMLAWTWGFYLILELSPSKPYPFYSRYILPIIPPLCVFAGIFASLLLPKKEEFSKRPAIRVLCLPWLLLMLILPLYLSSKYVMTMIPDTRDLAGEWIEANIPRNAKLLIEYKTFSYAPFINTSRKPFVEKDGYRIENLSPRKYEKYKTEKHGQYVICVLSGLRYERFLENPADVPQITDMYRKIISEEKLLKEFRPPFKPYGFNNPLIQIYAMSRRI